MVLDNENEIRVRQTSLILKLLQKQCVKTDILDCLQEMNEKICEKTLEEAFFREVILGTSINQILPKMFLENTTSPEKSN